jgi:hypothetical protein
MAMAPVHMVKDAFKKNLKSKNFSYFFDDFSKSHRYVAFWRQAATPAATAIFILEEGSGKKEGGWVE